MQQLNLFEPPEMQNKPANRNNRLVNWGILNDDSDFRVHIGYQAQHIFVFPTEEGKQLALKRLDENGELKEASQSSVNGIITGTGFAIPLSEFKNF